MKPQQTVLLALSFFTRLPLSRWAPPMDSVPLAQTAWAFPIAGGLIGLACGLFYDLLHLLFFPPALAVILMVAFQLWMTGALHEDGLADTADGFAGGYDKEARLKIMRDSRIGSFGALALLIVLMLRVWSLALLAHPIAVLWVMITSAAMSRAMIAAAMYTLPFARDDGLAQWAGRPTDKQTGISVGIAAGITLGILRWYGLAMLFVAPLACAAMCWLAKRKIGGITGDVYGAVQQVVETAMIVITVTMMLHG